MFQSAKTNQSTQPLQPARAYREIVIEFKENLRKRGQVLPKAFDNSVGSRSEASDLMQIHRYDNDPHGYAQPKSVTRSLADQRGIDRTEGVDSRQVASTSPSGSSDSRLTALSARLKNLSEIRADAVEFARSKIARGEYLTQQAARQLADSELQHEIF